MVIGNDDGFSHRKAARSTGWLKCARAIAIFLLTGLLFTPAINPALAAPTPVLNADGPLPIAQLAPATQYYIDDDWTATPEDILEPSPLNLQRVSQKEPDFGYTKSRIWLRFSFTNTTDDVSDWRVHFRENFKQIFDVYVARSDRQITNVLSLNRDSAFSDRPIIYPEMVAPVKVAPGETVTIIVSYWSEGSSHISYYLETAESFADIAVARMAKNFVYYGMIGILIIAALIAMVLLRQTVFLAYAAYAGATMMYLMHADGVAFEYIWPNLPRFNSIASIVTGGCFMVFAAVYARVFLQTKMYHPTFDKLLLAIVILAALTVLSAFVIDPQPIKKGMIPLALATIVLCTLVGLVAARDRFKQVRFYVLAWVGALLSSLVMNLRHLFGVELSQDLEFDGMRVAMVFDAVMMGLAIFDRYVQLRRSRHNAMQKSLDDAERNLRLNSRLHELETQYTLATEMVQSRDEEMKRTVHDLRQPLHALRLSVKSLASGNGQGGADISKVNETFSYLENLIAGQLKWTIDPADKADVSAIGADGPEEPNEDMSLPHILRSVHEMFLPDVQQKGLDFRVRINDHDVVTEPLVVMRIVTNLVSNAIKATQTGKVLLTARRCGNHVQVGVHDTGSGLSHEQFAAAGIASVTDPSEDTQCAIEGHGYGLSIVHSLCRKHDLKLMLDRRRRTGASIFVELPIKRGRAS